MMLSEFAPAKINLFLSVINKRSDGYHNIGTLFHTISCGDILWGESTDSGISISYNKAQEYPPERDLVYKAALALLNKYSVNKGARFYLQKELPMGAGLGGGSSDAAAALRLLNRLWELNLPDSELEAVGAKLGADVPFFIKGGCAFGEGIGEILTPQQPLDSGIILVATPNAFVPTAAAYAGIKPSGEERWETFKNNNSFLDLYNQFEDSVLPEYKNIAELKRKLNDLGGNSLLSGSGASVFSIFSSLNNAVNAMEAVKQECRFLTLASFLPRLYQRS